MAIANLLELCNGYCEIAGLAAPPALEVDEFGIRSFTISEGGLRIVVAQFESVVRNDAAIIVELGPVPEEHEEDLLPFLMESNFLTHGRHNASYSLHPKTGNVLMTTWYSLDKGTSIGLHEQVQAAIELSDVWHQQFGRVEQATDPLESMRTSFA